MNEKLHKKVSPPFEGGVVGSADYKTFTKQYFPDGVVDSNEYITEYKKMKKGINNQPPRPQISITKINKHFAAATPPSKGGEMYHAYIQYFTLCFVLYSHMILL